MGSSTFSGCNRFPYILRVVVDTITNAVLVIKLLEGIYSKILIKLPDYLLHPGIDSKHLQLETVHDSIKLAMLLQQLTESVLQVNG